MEATSKKKKKLHTEISLQKSSPPDANNREEISDKTNQIAFNDGQAIPEFNNDELVTDNRLIAETGNLGDIQPQQTMTEAGEYGAISAIEQYAFNDDAW
ncbi:conserved hypothetical protein [Ricinus communis]|uniref:Uncharacterized protein n=1 Tax=Ricinus communis TaxID=3988 RepID=B9SUT0_RICCO|nr:conserved hypothetical protein [Ricinus communis]